MAQYIPHRFHHKFCILKQKIMKNTSWDHGVWREHIYRTMLISVRRVVLDTIAPAGDIVNRVHTARLRVTGRIIHLTHQCRVARMECIIAP